MRPGTASAAGAEAAALTQPSAGPTTLAMPARVRPRNTPSPTIAPVATLRAVARSLQQASTAAGASADAASPSAARSSVPGPQRDHARQEAGARHERGAWGAGVGPVPRAGRRAVRVRETLEAHQRGRRAAGRQGAEGKPGQHGSPRSEARHAGGQEVDLGAGDATHVHLGRQPGGVEAPSHGEHHAQCHQRGGQRGASSRLTVAPHAGRRSRRAARARPGDPSPREPGARASRIGAPRAPPIRARSPGRPGRAGRARTGAGGRRGRRAGPRDAAPLPRRPRRRGRSAAPSRGST